MKIEGKGGMSAEIVADSISNNVRLTTLSLVYPRFIHAEFMTHRMFSRNASSSRAIPVDKLLKQIEEQPAMPIHWGKNQPGMQAREECTEELVMNTGDDREFKLSPEDAWTLAASNSSYCAGCFNKAGYHKQVVNRLTEPYQFIKVVVTATEWDNFFKLRLHPDAQPEIQELARVMKEAMDNHTPRELEVGDWHVPFVNDGYLPSWNKESFDAIRCSVARLARVSYQNHDGTDPDIVCDLKLADDLLAAGHMSPFEHVATPMRCPTTVPFEDEAIWAWDIGATHMDENKNLWSGNFRGWIQYRQFIQQS